MSFPTPDGPPSGWQPPSPPVAPQPPPRHRDMWARMWPLEMFDNRRANWAATIFVAVTLLGDHVFGGTFLGVKSQNDNGAVPSSERDVAYIVGGGGGDVTLATPTGSTQIQGVVGRVGLYAFRSGDYVYLSVQGDGSSPVVTCTITSNGVIVSQNSASGDYAIATCEGHA